LETREVKIVINLRKATMDDYAYILEVRNDQEIRLTSGESSIVKEEEHILWLKQFLSKDNHFYFIGEQDSKSIGMVRFQPYKGHINQSEISITIYPKTKQKKGLGTELLMHGIKYLKENTEIKEVIARVRKTNQYSFDFFKRNGFLLFLEDDHYFVFRFPVNEGIL
jgi:RimJ/RimL family protein N-acetyltransferase